MHPPRRVRRCSRTTPCKVASRVAVDPAVLRSGITQVESVTGYHVQDWIGDHGVVRHGGDGRLVDGGHHLHPAVCRGQARVGEDTDTGVVIEDAGRSDGSDNLSHRCGDRGIRQTSPESNGVTSVPTTPVVSPRPSMMVLPPTARGSPQAPSDSTTMTSARMGSPVGTAWPQPMLLTLTVASTVSPICSGATLVYSAVSMRRSSPESGPRRSVGGCPPVPSATQRGCPLHRDVRGGRS